MYTLQQYLFTLDDSLGLTRTLGEVELCRRADGSPEFFSGNRAIVFRIRHAGKSCALRCFRQPHPYIKAIYGSQRLEQELFLYDTPRTGRWVDVVVSEWIEGEVFRTAIERAALAHDRLTLSRYASLFDELAATLLNDDWAHGDLKPENIILTPTGTLRLIDFDAAYYPTLQGQQAIELGTPQYQHRQRSIVDFDARLDDYPAALIATALHALSLDPTLYDRYGARDGLLFAPDRLAEDNAYREAMELFSAEGHALWYRIGCRLLSPTPRLHRIGAYFAEAGRRAPHETGSPLDLFCDEGLWGFRNAEGVVIPAIYDNGFDFSEGVAAVQIGARWHFIDPRGEVVLHLPPCEIVKPMRNGRAEMRCGGIRRTIDREGHLLDI